MSECWLAIDTATETASVAVGVAGQPVLARTIRGARAQAALLIPTIQQLLADARTPLADVAGVVVGDGPGSFTGLRIGWAAARGLTYENELPVLAVPSLLGFAHAAHQDTGDVVVACFDALRGQVFAAVYAFHRTRLETLVAPALCTLAELARATPVRPARGVGDGADRYAGEIAAWTGRAPVALDALTPVAASLLALAPEHGYTAPAEPSYGRAAEAQVKWEARYGRSLPHTPR
jgi:tRNA threonylcarbamoyladenosine biosynthesis protein TsaB